MSITKIPGCVDVHVHLREPGATQKEDFESGTKAAIAGGYTTVLDMPNNPDSIVTPDLLEDKINKAEGRIYSDLGFQFGGEPTAIAHFKEVKDKVFGLKVYMNHTTGNLLIEDEKVLDDIWANWPRGKVIMVHAEGPTLAKAINLSKKYNQRLHVCHLSLANEIDQVKAARIEGMDITCEVSCHHLFLTNQDVERLGSFGIMKPPLSSKEDVEYIWKNLDVIDMIASDHAPHTLEEKKVTEKPPFGVPGLETSLPLLLNAVNQGKLTLERVIKLTSTNPRKLFSMLKDPDTYVEIDLDEEWTIKNENIISKSGWTPFDGLRIKGKVKKVVLHGKIAFENGEIKGPFGKVIFPKSNN